MSYQKCPVCNGFGSIGIGFPIGEICKVCGGAGIISADTGKPPKNNISYTDSTGNTERGKGE